MHKDLDKAKEIRKGEELDWAKLETYLRTEIFKLEGELSVSQFHGGHANLTYLLAFGATELVLRRPPFGKIAPGAHDMKREYKVLSKLYQYFPPAPRAYHFCEDDAIIGAPFVVIERKRGVVVRNKILDCFKDFEQVENRISDAVVRAQANLHLVDYEKAGLSNLGKPEGFLERQVAGWSKRWALSKTEDNKIMDSIWDKLGQNIPKPQRASIIHNDVKPDNCQFQSDNPDEVTAMFDWDMCTIGDPLIDFGTTLSYFPDDRNPLSRNLPLSLQGNWPNKDFLRKKYQEYTGFNLDKINWYEVFSYCKGAVIMQQLYKRYVDGATKDERMKYMGMVAKSMAELADSIMED